MKKVFALLLGLSAIVFAPSCKDDEEDCAATASALQDKSAAMQNAAIAYGTNPSTANCVAYKNAVQSYIDEARDLVDCPGLSAAEKAQYQQSLDAAEANLGTLSC